jgi:hemerythrin-like domain-containing protein
MPPLRATGQGCDHGLKSFHDLSGQPWELLKLSYAKGGIDMLPIGPMMIEHRLIERMIKVMRHELFQAEAQQKIDPRFIETATDFIRAYADQCHHGKEEDILFRELKKKKIAPEHHTIMEELVEEHKRGRQVTGRLVEANSRYMKGDEGALAEILEGIRTLIGFYPKHIEKEDKNFFLPIMGYFSKEEKDAMLTEGYRFDADLLHEEYQKTVKEAERGLPPKP